MNHDEGFIPDIVDEQVERLSSLARQRSLPPSAQVVHRLHALYEADKHSTERVWERLAQHMTGDNGSVQPAPRRPEALDELQEERFQHMQQALHLPRRTEPSRFALVAAAMFTVLLVSSLLWVLHIAHSTRTATSTATTQASPPGLYVGTLDEVSRLDVQTRNVIWRTPIPIKDRSRFAPTPVVIGDTVYVTLNGSSAGGTLLALNAQTGAFRWSRGFNTNVAQPYMADGLLFVYAFFNATLYGLNPADGAIRVSYNPGHGGWGAPIVVDGVLYYTLGTDLYALKIPGEKPLWHQQVSRKQRLGRLYVKNGIVYVTSQSDSGLIYAFDARTGNKLWQSPAIPVGVRIVNITDDMIYAASFGGALYAFDAHTHVLAWYQQIDTFDMVVASGIVYLSYSPGNVDYEDIIALRATDGKELWQRNIAGGLFVLGARRRVFYVVDWGGNGKNGTVYALRASDGSPLWHMPTGGSPLQWSMTVA